MRPDTEPWWKQAQADLKTADVAMQAGQFYAASWFAQQATEKALKALLLEQTAQLPPRTHDLRFLGGQLSVPSAIETDLIALYPAFDLARFPRPSGLAPVDAVSSSDATDHPDAARRIVAWAGSQL